MAHPLAPDFRRFLPAWLAFGSSVSFTAFVMMVAVIALGAAGDEGTSDMPPMVVLAIAVIAYFVALIVGLFVVPFRRLIIGPRFPFVRRGYLVMAALPLAWLIAPGAPLFRRIYMALACEVLLAISAALFVGLGWLFGAFDADER